LARAQAGGPGGQLNLIEPKLAQPSPATIHPSSILRGEPDQREAQFVASLV
jgi:hypothetical protein